MKSVDAMISAMPRMQRDQRDKAIRATCEQVKEETLTQAAGEVGKLLDTGASDTEIIAMLRTWVKVTRELGGNHDA